MSKRMTGTVKWFNEAKGYGFIQVEGMRDIFVHYSGIAGNGYRILREGEHVTFVLTESAKGQCATEVRLDTSAGM